MLLHISNSPATIAYPCNTHILVIRIPMLHSGLLLLVMRPVENKIVFNVVERVVLLIPMAKCTGTVHTRENIVSDIGA